MACSIDHSMDDVEKKLESQSAFLPEGLYKSSDNFLKGNPTQEELNELFHLLKKYDLAPEEERAERNRKITALTS
ncbi:group-specific protein [Pseudalkalibacillus salsuginis]|uniref:group-specific protein n=1 Tax=Pseudalkalibacillus salsuginis TaxID=2910972 RepID=UPI001F3E6590|nr:group-specific protein [Pseudalkalibacillus salsuginis]MCF6410302.1 group-specific protein [Pseudalkalibacillus salsuginis]